jgi:putative salt-induced outer membrane protein YdiY
MWSQLHVWNQLLMSFLRAKSNYRSQLILLLSFYFVLACASRLQAQPAILFLKNGDRISGVITSEDTNSVVLTNGWSKALTIPLAEISRREKPLASVPSTNAPAVAAQAQPAAGKGTNQMSAAEAAVAAAKAPGAKPVAPKHWAVDVLLGLDFGLSERKHQNYTGHSKVTYGKDRFRHVLDYDFAYGRTEGITSANRMDGASKADYDLTPKWYVYSLATLGYDQIRKIDYRFEIGPGIGYHLFKRTNFVFNLEGGVDYQSQHLKDDTRPDLFFYRLAENATWQLTPRLSWDEKFEYLTRVEKLNEYKLRLESNVRYALVSNFSLVLTVLDLFESRPPTGVSKNDLQVRSAVSVKF